jgi:hypothetical protein
MSAAITTPAFRPTRGLRQCLVAVADFAQFGAERPTFCDVIMRRVDDPSALLMVGPPRLTVVMPPCDGDETLTDIIVAARRLGIPVAVDFEGSYLWADLDFNGLIVRAMGDHTTCGARYALESLASCPIGDLDRTLGAIAEAREKWGL